MVEMAIERVIAAQLLASGETGLKSVKAQSRDYGATADETQAAPRH